MFDIPFELRESTIVKRKKIDNNSFEEIEITNYHQTSVLSFNSNPFNKDNMEEILSKIALNQLNEKINIRGLVAEILAIKAIEDTFASRVYFNLPNVEGYFIRSQGRFNINVSNKYVANMHPESERVYILRKDDSNGSNEPKFNFRVAEIDGIYLLKKRDATKNLKEYFAIEVKSGNVNLTSTHIIKNIIEPLKRMYKSDFTYILVGFREFLYSETRKEEQQNILNPQIKRMKETLERHNIRFIPIHFPFSRREFEDFTRQIEERRTGMVKGSGYVFDQNNGEIKLQLPNGRTLSGNITEIEIL